MQMVSVDEEKEWVDINTDGKVYMIISLEDPSVDSGNDFENYSWKHGGELNSSGKKWITLALLVVTGGKVMRGLGRVLGSNPNSDGKVTYKKEELVRNY